MECVSCQQTQFQPVEVVHLTSRLFSTTSQMKSQCDPDTSCRIGARCRKTSVIMLAKSSLTSSSPSAIHTWQARITFTARCCGRNTTSESGSGALAQSKRRYFSPVVSESVGLTPRRAAANSLRYLSSLGGSGAYAVIQAKITMAVWGAWRRSSKLNRCS